MQGVLRAALVVVLATASAAADQIVTISPTSDFVEWLDDEPKVSGGERLVGLRLGRAASPHFDPAEIRVPVPPKGGRICGRSVSRDGLYGSVLPFGTVGGGAAQARLQPFSRRFVDRLIGYGADEMGVLIFSVSDSDCLGGDRLVLPLLGETDPTDLRLFAFANSGNRKTTATLVTDTRSVGGACREVDGVRVGFDRLCEIVVAPATDLMGAELVLEYDDFLAPERETYAVYLPPTGASAGRP